MLLARRRYRSRYASSGCRGARSWAAPRGTAAAGAEDAAAGPSTAADERGAAGAGAAGPEAKGWQEVAGCAVLFPRGPPTAVVHFLGGAFVGASPRLFYQTFLECVAEEAQAVVVATPYKLAFDYDTTAADAAAAFEASRSELVARGALPDVDAEALPTIAVGHSCGALLHALLAVDRPRAGCVLMSFNNRPVREAIPVELPPSPQDQRLREFLSNGLEAALGDKRVEASLRAGGAVAQLALGAVRGSGNGDGAPAAPRAGSADRERAAREAAPLLSQLGPLLGSVVEGERDFTISQEEISKRLSGKYAVPRTLLVQFANDLTDETSRLAGILAKGRSQPAAEGENSEAPAAGETLGAEGPIAVERLRLPGGHTAPIDYPGLARGDAARIRRLAAAIARFARGEAAAEGPSGREAAVSLAELKAQLLRLTAGTNRGFSPARPEQRAEILACVEEIEALSPTLSPPDTAEVPEAQVPAALFGNWRLVWATSPDVLLLAALPLVDCGEIRQDIPAQEVRPGQPLEVLNSVELSPRGFGLLGVLPQLARAASVRAVVRALAEPLADGASLGIRFEGGRIEPALPGLPALPLPELPSVRLTSSATGSSIRLLTSFLDSELRFARSPLGDVFVLCRVD